MHHRRSRARTLLLATALASMTTWGCTDSIPPELIAPARMIAISGDNQSANGAALGQPLVVQVLNGAGESVADVTVNWSTTDPGASLSAASSVTDGNGLASVTWTLGTTPGRQTVTATT